MLSAKHKYHHDVILNKYVKVYDLKSNGAYIFLQTPV